MKLTSEIVEGIEPGNDKVVLRIRDLFIKPKINHFEYKNGACNRQWESEYLEKDILYFKEPEDFVCRLPSYSTVISTIRLLYKAEEAYSRGLLAGLAARILHEYSKGITTQVLSVHVDTVISDLEGEGPVWELKTWIDGVWLEDEKYTISEEVSIRQPRVKDFDEEQPVHTLTHSRLNHHHNGSAIIEQRIKTKDQKKVSQAVESVVHSLRLLRLGSVYSIMTESRPKSFIEHSGILTSTENRARNYIYKLEVRDLPRLNGLMAIVKKILPQDGSESLPKSYVPLSIALRRYTDATIKQEVIEGRITLAITCLEALYLKANERMELDHRLSQRTSKVMSLFALDPPEVYTTVRRAYRIRSSYIHGSQLSPSKHPEANDIAKRLLEWARLSINVFLHLAIKLDKDGLIDRIDQR